MSKRFDVPWSVLPAIARVALPDEFIAEAQQAAIRSCLLSPQGRVISIDREHNGARLRLEFDVDTWGCLRVLQQSEVSDA